MTKKSASSTSDRYPLASKPDVIIVEEMKDGAKTPRYATEAEAEEFWDANPRGTTQFGGKVERSATDEGRVDPMSPEEKKAAKDDKDIGADGEAHADKSQPDPNDLLPPEVDLPEDFTGNPGAKSKGSAAKK